MEYLIMLILLFFVFPCLLIIWIVRLVKLYKKGKSKRYSFNIQTLVLVVSMSVVLWMLGIFPLSRNFQVMSRTEELTGKSFWSWEEFSFDEISVRGEGYSIDIFRFNDETAAYFNSPDRTFFQKYPLHSEYYPNGPRVTWKKTPVVNIEKHLLEFVTPNYGWNQEKKDRIQFVRNLANREGAYYSYYGKADRIDFFIIAPKERLIVLINHNT